MDILKEKQTINKDYFSRYNTFYAYYNTEDNKYMYGLTSQLDQNTNYIVHKVKENDNLDYLSNLYYGRPDYFWVIADFNQIQDVFINLYQNFKTIKVPALGSIQFKG